MPQFVFETGAVVLIELRFRSLDLLFQLRNFAVVRIVWIDVLRGSISKTALEPSKNSFEATFIRWNGRCLGEEFEDTVGRPLQE